MDWVKNQQQYLSLMRQFLSGHFNVHQFDGAFTTLWKTDRDAEWATILAQDTEHDRWGQSTNPADILLQLEQRTSSRSTDQRVYRSILDQVFTTLDVYRPAPVEAWEIDEVEVRRVITEAVRRLAALDVAPPA